MFLARLARAPKRPWWRNALTGLAFAAGGLFVRWAGQAFYGEVTGFIILLPAVVLAALAGGRVAGLVAAAACLLGGWVIAGPTAVGFGIATPPGRVATVNFLIVGGFVTIVAASLRKSLIQLGETVAALEASQDALRRNEAELTAMVDQAAAGIAKVGMDGAVISANARFAELLGYTSDTVVGVTTKDVSHPDDIQATIDLLSNVLSGGDGGQVEKRYLRPDGTVVWALTSLRALRDADGDQAGYIAVSVDITDAKAAEAALRESETRFRLMADTAPSPVWLTNAEGEVEFVNAALVDFYGKPGETFMGHAWKASIHPDDIADVNATQSEARGPLPALRLRMPVHAPRRRVALDAGVGQSALRRRRRVPGLCRPVVRRDGDSARPSTPWPSRNAARGSCWS